MNIRLNHAAFKSIPGFLFLLATTLLWLAGPVAAQAPAAPLMVTEQGAAAPRRNYDFTAPALLDYPPLEFPETEVNQSQTAISGWYHTVQNQTMTFSNLRFQQGDASNFSIVSNGCVNVPANQICNIVIKFAPTSKGLKGAYFYFDYAYSGGSGDTIRLVVFGDAVSCDIEPLTDLTGDALEFDQYSLANDGRSIIRARPGGGEIDDALACLRQADSSLNVSSHWRPAGYQVHFAEVFNRWIVKGLKNNDKPECRMRKQDIQPHAQAHRIANVVCTLEGGAGCPHPSGRAFDATSALSITQLDTLAAQCSLHRPVANDGDGVHFELIKKPVITSLSPNASRIRNTPLKITVNGYNFSTGAVVRWNGQDRPTRYESKRILVATIPAADLQSPGVFQIRVYNANSVGDEGLSDPKNFTVTAPQLQREDDNVNSAVQSLETALAVNSPVLVKARQEAVGDILNI